MCYVIVCLHTYSLFLKQGLLFVIGCFIRISKPKAALWSTITRNVHSMYFTKRTALLNASTVLLGSNSMQYLKYQTRIWLCIDLPSRNCSAYSLSDYRRYTYCTLSSVNYVLITDCVLMQKKSKKICNSTNGTTHNKMIILLYYGEL